MKPPADGKESAAYLRAEIQEQPGRIADALAGVAVIGDRLGKLVDHAETVVLLGRGSSRSAATFGAYAVRTLTGKLAMQLSPVELGWTASRFDLSRSLVVAVSQSGESHETLAAAERVVAQGAHLLVVTNSPDSALAGLASDHESVLHCRAGVERAIPATKSYTTTLACLLGLALSAHPGRLEHTRRALPTHVENVLADADARIDLSGLEGIVTVGEGFAESVAEEGAIKIRETMQKLVTAMEASELLHGSINCLGRGHGLLAIAADALGAHLANKTLVEARARGVSTMFIGPDVQVAADQRVVLPEVPAEWIPLLAILPIQRAACEASVAAGSDPDRPVGLRKITRVQASGTR